MKPTALIATTQCWVPTARLGMALARAGFTVRAVCPPRHPLRRIRGTDETYPYHGLRALASLQAAMAVARPDIVIAGDDLAARHLHDLYRSERRRGKPGKSLRDLIECSLGAPESSAVLEERTRVMELAREEGIRVPDTKVVNNDEELESSVAEMGFPSVLKQDGTSGAAGVRILHTLNEAKRAFCVLQSPPLLARAGKRALLDHDATLVWPSLLRRRSIVNVQAFVNGGEATSAIACWQGSVLGSLHFEVLHRAYALGPSTVVRRIDDAGMNAAAEKLARRLQLSGLYGLDFIREAATGIVHLIEINPRATQVGHLALGPGRDLAGALYGAVTGKMVPAAPPITENDVIALFPQEWTRDSESDCLRSAYHDVPWEEPALVLECVRNRQKHAAWYSARTDSQAAAEVALLKIARPVAHGIAER